MIGRTVSIAEVPAVHCWASGSLCLGCTPRTHSSPSSSSATGFSRSRSGMPFTLESDDRARRRNVAAFVDGGPASFEITGGALDLTFDTRDGGGQLLEYTLNGRMNGDELEGVLTPPLNAPQGNWRATTPRRAAGCAGEACRFHGSVVAHIIGSRARHARLHAGRAKRRRRLSLPRRSGVALRVAGTRARVGVAVSARDRAKRRAGHDSLRELPRGAPHFLGRSRYSREAAAPLDGLFARPMGRLDARRRDDDADAGLSSISAASRSRRIRASSSGCH